MTATMTKCGALDCQVCVPKEWTDEQAIAYAEKEFSCGTENGWQIRRAGDPLLDGAPERMQCASRPTHVHIMMDA
jgi:hypothetical protein